MFLDKVEYNQLHTRRVIVKFYYLGFYEAIPNILIKREGPAIF